MNTAQRVVRRNVLLSRLLTALAVLALVILIYGTVRENLPPRLLNDWPWRLKLMDGQSATAAALATTGAALARAQYARTVRPALGFFGRAVAGVAPEERIAWQGHLQNAAQDVAVITEVRYLVTFAEPTGGQAGWVEMQRAAELIAERGAVVGHDFRLSLIGAGRPLPAQGRAMLGWFTAEAMAVVESVWIRVRVTDRVGDTHERVMDLLVGANRVPVHPDPELS
ncbi:hypothetical protein [Kitasatospora sp. P5_F3]